jgi:hypothetical protein
MPHAQRPSAAGLAAVQPAVVPRGETGSVTRLPEPSRLREPRDSVAASPICGLKPPIRRSHEGCGCNTLGLKLEARHRHLTPTPQRYIMAPPASGEHGLILKQADERGLCHQSVYNHRFQRNGPAAGDEYTSRSADRRPDLTVPVVPYLNVAPICPEWCGRPERGPGGKGLKGDNGDFA